MRFVVDLSRHDVYVMPSYIWATTVKSAHYIVDMMQVYIDLHKLLSHAKSQ